MRAASSDGGEEAGSVQGQHQVQVVFGVGEGGEAKAGARGVLQVRAGVVYCCDAHFEIGGWAGLCDWEKVGDVVWRVEG